MKRKKTNENPAAEPLDDGLPAGHQPQTQEPDRLGLASAIIRTRPLPEPFPEPLPEPLPSPLPLVPPYIIGFLPFSGPPGTQVEISGDGFVSVQSVTFGGVPASFSVAAQNRIFAIVPFGGVSGPIRVTNPAGTAASFSPFTVTQASGQPAVTGFNPTSGMPGEFITITGANFTGATRVTFNGRDAAQFGVAGDNFISARVPTGATTGPVAVSNAAGTGQSPGVFVVTGAVALPPSISGFDPLSGGPGTQVRIFGANFLGATQVLFNNALAQFTVVAANQINATVPPAASTGPIRVVTPAGTATSFNVFALSAGGPVVTSVSPASGAPGTQVTIQGVNLSPLLGVRFGGVPALSFSSLGSNFAVAVVPYAISGPLEVMTPAGSAFFPFTVTRLAYPFGSLQPGAGLEI